VRALLRRHAPSPRRPLLRWEDLALDTAAHEAWRGQRALDLTAQEFKLLEQFLEHPRQVLTRQGLLSSVWGFPTETASNVVDVYVGYLRQKLESAGEPRVIQTLRGVGYVLRSG
jgi:two-component system response regulator MprA